MFEIEAFKGLSEEAKKDFGAIVWQFSPENLSCDGELSRSQVKVKLTGLKRAWKALEKKYNVQIDPYSIV